jgi:hypothetical protein
MARYYAIDKHYKTSDPNIYLYAIKSRTIIWGESERSNTSQYYIYDYGQVKELKIKEYLVANDYGSQYITFDTGVKLVLPQTVQPTDEIPRLGKLPLTEVDQTPHDELVLKSAQWFPHELRR